MKFQFHDEKSAPESAREDLANVKKTLGAIPNLTRGLAASPAALKTYLAISQILEAHATLSPVERQVVYLTTSVANGCRYCVSAHTMLARRADMPEPVLAALLDETALADARLEALRQFTKAILETGARPSSASRAAFTAAGFDAAQVGEILTIIAHKTLSNSFNHLAEPELDEMFASFAWTPPGAATSALLGHRRVGHGATGVIVLHDWLGDAANYDALIPWLDVDEHTYVFADVRGYGRSRQMRGAHNADEVARDVFALADHLGWARFHLVGHSMNGLAGFKTLLRDWQGERRIERFVGIAPVTPDGYPASEDDKAFLAAAIDDDATAEAAFGALTGGALGPRWARAKRERTRAQSSPDVVRAFYEMWLNEDFSRDFAEAKIATPVLVVGGRNDLPGFQQAHYDKTLREWLVDVEFKFIENAGHYPMQETPVLLANLIDTHLRGGPR